MRSTHHVASGRGGHTHVVSLASHKRFVRLYVNATVEGGYLAEAHADRLGNVSVGKSCIRFKKLDDLDLDGLAELVKSAAANPASAG